MTQNTAGSSNIPVVTAGNDIAVCAGTPAVIGSMTPGSGGTGPYTYNWTPAASLNNSVLPNPTATAASTTTYVLTLTDFNACTDSDTMTLFINPLPVFSLGADTTLCGGSIALNGPSGYNTYNWNTGDTTQGIPVSASAGLSLTVTDLNGCTGSDTIAVTIYSLPAVSIGPDSIQCGRHHYAGCR